MNRRRIQYRAILAVMAIAGLWFANSAAAQSPTIRAVALSDQPAPGTPNGEVYLGFNPFCASLNDAGQVAFLGSAMFTDGSGINEGVWSEGTGELVLVAKEHDPAPGADSNMRFSTFQNTVLNNTGQTLFEAGLTNFVSDERGTWSNRTGDLARVIGNGVQAPGTSDGTTFIGFGGIVFNDLGQTAFKAGVTGADVVNTNGEGIWSDGSGTLTLVARGGSQAAGMPVGENFDVLDFPVLNDHGQTAFYGYVVGGEAGSGQGIWSEQAGVLGLVASSGNPAPGADGGVNFQGFSSPSFNNAGQTSFWAYLDSSNPNAGESYHDGIWSEGSGSLELVALRGEQAPGTPTGVHYGRENTITFDSPVLNDFGQVAFRGQVGGAGVDDTNEEAIWIGDAQGVALVARAGDQAPGAPEGVTFDNFFPWHGALQLSEAGQVVFTAFLIDEAVQPFSGGYGIWATDSQGDLTLIARTGEELEIAPGDFRSIIDLNLVGEATGSSDGRPSAVNSHGQIAFWAKYDGGEGIFVSNQVAVPEPSTLLLVTMGLWVAVFSRPDMRASVQRRLQQLMGVLLIMLSVNIACADIFEWEYINHANPAEGKRQSTILTPTGAGAIAEPGAFLPGRDLTKAYLIGYNLNGYWVDGGEFG